jgi:hypothetical protein
VAVKRGVGGEPFGDAHDLVPEHPQLPLDRLVTNLPGVVEEPGRTCDWNDVWDRPGSKRPNRELHRVDGLKALHSTGSADQADHLVVR